MCTMRLVFVDDSGQQDPPRAELGDLVALGAVIVPEDQVTGFASDLIAIKSRLGIPEDEEIKWKPARGSFLAHAGGEAVTALRESMLRAAIDRGFTSVVHVLDHSLVYRDRTVVQVGQELLKWTYDKVAFGLEGQGAVVIADKPGGGSADESRWLAQTLAVTNDGTTYTEAGKVVLPVLTASSHHVPHLQLADLVTAATTAAIAGRPHGLHLVPLLHQMARKNSWGYAGGAGITLWPPQLRDLLYWVFHEDTYVKDVLGYPLGPADTSPASSLRPFHDHDGMPLGPSAKEGATDR
jgi:hypothetical protein